VRPRQLITLLFFGVVLTTMLLRGSGALRTAARKVHPPPASGATPTTAGAHDLVADETEGGHTLERHVGRSDAELAERLAHEPGISTASTFSDRATAERVVAAAIDRNRARVDKWLASGGGNLAIDYRGAPGELVGRSLGRGDSISRESFDARVVLARRGGSYFVLTAYPLEPR